jgi:hypothetical protein
LARADRPFLKVAMSRIIFHKGVNEMRSFAALLGVTGMILSLAFWIIVSTSHSIYAHPGLSAIPIVMFLLLAVGAVGSVLVAFGVRWAPALMALAVIPASAAYLVPGLMVMTGALAAASVAWRLPSANR